MHRIWAIIERDLRRFRRSPTLIIVSMIMPLVQLVVLGYAFGGKVKNLEVGVVDQDHGVPAVKLKEMFQAVAANARTFETVAYADQATALARPAQRQDQRRAQHPAALLAQGAGRRQSAPRADRGQHRPVRRRDARGHAQRAARAPTIEPLPAAAGVGARRRSRSSRSIRTCPTSSTCCPARIVLAIFVSAMIGGGIIFIDDKARGLHEGYLVTPDPQVRADPRLHPGRRGQGDPRRHRAGHRRLADRRHPRTRSTRSAWRA